MSKTRTTKKAKTPAPGDEVLVIATTLGKISVPESLTAYKERAVKAVVTLVAKINGEAAKAVKTAEQETKKAARVEAKAKREAEKVERNKAKAAKLTERIAKLQADVQKLS